MGYSRILLLMDSQRKPPRRSQIPRDLNEWREGTMDARVSLAEKQREQRAKGKHMFVVLVGLNPEVSRGEHAHSRRHQGQRSVQGSDEAGPWGRSQNSPDLLCNLPALFCLLLLGNWVVGASAEKTALGWGMGDAVGGGTVWWLRADSDSDSLED